MTINRTARNKKANELTENNYVKRDIPKTARFTEEETKSIDVFLAENGLKFQEFCHTLIAEKLGWEDRIVAYEGNKKAARAQRS